MSVASIPFSASALMAEQGLASLELAAPRLGGYEIIELIGEGTYGEVWRARETETSVIVAIKRFRYQPDEQCCAEVEHLAKLSAVRGIVALRKIHLQAQPYCYVMEHLPGGTLAGSIRQDGAMSFQDSWQKFRRLVEALCYVHRDGIVHGDIKPENILLDSAGNPRICDFGQARALGSHGHMLGTPFYMPPEQARFEGLPDPRWDVYAVGAILFEMLTGMKPRFDVAISKLLTSPTRSGTEARDRLEQYAKKLEQSPSLDAHRRVPGVDGPVGKLIDHCLSLDFQERPADANAVWRLIEQCEHTRRSRPLFVFGGIAPAILFLLLGLAILIGGRWMLARVSQQWQENVAASNRAVAQAIGSSIRDSFNERMRIVRDAARNSEWQALLQRRDKEGMDEALKRLYKESRGQIHRWSVIDSDGWLLANYGRLVEGGQAELDASDVGVDETPIGKNFSWRGWFNGIEDGERNLLAPSTEGLAAFRNRTGRKPFVGQPIWRVGERGFAVTPISCPIASSDNEPPSGILIGAFPYRQLIGWVAEFEQIQGEERRNVVLVNDKYQVIYHPKLANEIENLRDRKEKNSSADVALEPSVFAVPTISALHFQRALAGDMALGSYEDPLDQQRYFGSAAVTTLDYGQKLAIVVQQEEDAALRPIRTLRSIVNGFAIALLAVGLLFLASNTYALYWFLRNQRESAAYV